MSNDDACPPFPCSPVDAQGVYRWHGHFRVQSKSIERFAVIEWARRDLVSAHEAMRECCNDAWEDHDSPVHQALWWAAVIEYSKPFGTNHSRGALPRGWAEDYLLPRLDHRGRLLHEYVLCLRDRMIAHDDGLGEDKAVFISLPPSRPRQAGYIGVGTGKDRVTALGTNRARELEPHYRQVERIFDALWQEQWEAVRQHLLRTDFADVTLLAQYSEGPLEMGIEEVVAKYGRAGMVPGKWLV